MTTLLFVFFAALALCLALTPLVGAIAIRYDITHEPTERCTHTKPIPRIGGIAMYLTFFLSLGLCTILNTDITNLLLHNQRLLAIFAAATLLFFFGLCDDIYGLSAKTKFFGQILAGLITWYGGVQINIVSISPVSGLELGWLSLPANRHEIL